MCSLSPIPRTFLKVIWTILELQNCSGWKMYPISLSRQGQQLGRNWLLRTFYNSKVYNYITENLQAWKWHTFLENLIHSLTVLMVKMCFHVSGMGLLWFLYAHCHPTTQWRTWFHFVGDLSIGIDRLLWDAVSPDFPEVALCCPTLPKIVLLCFFSPWSSQPV